MISDFRHVPGRTVSPCRDCEKRQPGYACLKGCTRPASYSLTLGAMSGSVPTEMTPQGRQLAFQARLAPGYSRVHSAASRQQVVARARQLVRMARREQHQCRFPGCVDACRSLYCQRHRQRLYLRIILLAWPAQLAYAPPAPGRHKLLVDLLQAERCGELDQVDWYLAAQRDHAAGLMAFKRRSGR